MPHKLKSINHHSSISVMVVFFPLVSVMEFDKRRDGLHGRTYTMPLLTDAPDEFDTCPPAYLNRLAVVLAGIFDEPDVNISRDDLCRAFLLAFFVSDASLAKLEGVLGKYGARLPSFTDYRFIQHRSIKDPEAIKRHHAMIRAKYNVRCPTMTMTVVTRKARPPS
jgi:hypothetical protein